MSADQPADWFNKWAIANKADAITDAILMPTMDVVSAGYLSKLL